MTKYARNDWITVRIRNKRILRINHESTRTQFCDTKCRINEIICLKKLNNSESLNSDFKHIQMQ